MEDCKGNAVVVRAGGGLVVVAQWQSTGCTNQVSWVWFLVLSLSSNFASKHLNSLYSNFQHETRVPSTHAYVHTAAHNQMYLITKCITWF